MAKFSESQARLGYQIFNWVGIINQLVTNRAERTLFDLKLPLAQFVILNHFSHRPHESKTVTSISSAMQQPQPGVTKTVQKLLGRKFLKAEPDPADKRSKLLTITPKGQEIHQRAIVAFVPRFAESFDGWDEAEMQALFQQLDRLKVWLDSKGRE